MMNIQMPLTSFHIVAIHIVIQILVAVDLLVNDFVQGSRYYHHTYFYGQAVI